MEHRQNNNADVVLHPLFELGIVKILRERPEQMFDLERDSVSNLAFFDVDVATNFDDLLLAVRALKKLRPESTLKKYADLSFLRTTTNTYECSFNKAVYAIPDGR